MNTQLRAGDPYRTTRGAVQTRGKGLKITASCPAHASTRLDCPEHRGGQPEANGGVARLACARHSLARCTPPEDALAARESGLSGTSGCRRGEVPNPRPAERANLCADPKGAGPFRRGAPVGRGPPA